MSYCPALWMNFNAFRDVSARANHEAELQRLRREAQGPVPLWYANFLTANPRRSVLLEQLKERF